MRSEKVTFPGSSGTPLAGRLDMPDDQPQAVALFAHCCTCSKDVLAVSRMAQALTGFGINNHAAATILIGHSLGGAAVLAVAEHLPEVRDVATIGAPAGTEHLLHLLDESRHEIEENGEAVVCLASRPFRIRKQFLDDVLSQPQLERIQRLGVPLLVMHWPIDDTVGVDNARAIFDAARHPKSFVSLDGADHLLSRPADARFAAAVLAAWASRYLDGNAGPAPDSTDSAAGIEDGVVVVSESGRGRYGQGITAGRHQLTADEPEPVGRVAPLPDPRQGLRGLRNRVRPARPHRSGGRAARGLGHRPASAADRDRGSMPRAPHPALRGRRLTSATREDQPWVEQP